MCWFFNFIAKNRDASLDEIAHDVKETFGEDASLIRLRDAARDFAFLRRAALNLFRADESESISLPGIIKTAAYSPDHSDSALQLRST